MAANSNSSSFTGSLLVALAALAVFAALVFFAYGMKSEKAPLVATIDNPPPSAASLRAQDAGVLQGYGWVDKEKGVVRIPVDKAADLVIEELNK